MTAPENLTVDNFAGIEERIAAAVNDRRFLPYHGWHDDHRDADRTPKYRPAIQQSRAEFVAFARMLDERRVNRRCLQLGLGHPGAAHAAFAAIFQHAWTIDESFALVARYRSLFPQANLICGDTRAEHTRAAAAGLAPFDLLFVDAGHKLADVAADFEAYAPLVLPGGVIAFHDALKRPTYEEEIEVWKFLDVMRAAGEEVHMIGDELGIAYVVQE